VPATIDNGPVGPVELEFRLRRDTGGTITAFVFTRGGHHRPACSHLWKLRRASRLRELHQPSATSWSNGSRPERHGRWRPQLGNSSINFPHHRRMVFPEGALLISLSRHMFSTIGPLRNRSLTLSLFLFLGERSDMRRAKSCLCNAQAEMRARPLRRSWRSPRITPWGIGLRFCVRAGNSNTQVFTASDSNGNTYHSALQLGITASAFTFAIFTLRTLRVVRTPFSISDTVFGSVSFRHPGVLRCCDIELFGRKLP